MNDVNRQWRVARESQSQGMCLEPEVFGYHEETVPEPEDGQFLVRNLYFACEPLVHAFVKGVPGRIPALPVGSVLKGHAGGRVVASKHPDFAVGDVVHGNIDWADYVVLDGRDAMGNALSRVPAGTDIPTGMITLGMTGLCAYIGLFDIGRPKPGDTVVVSAASGGIGVLVGQLAKLAGATVIGISGGGAKKQRLMGDAGYDAVIDYKSEDVTARLGEMAPRGVNVFFDNVGGAVLDAVLVNLANYGRIVVCGGISSYDDPNMAVRNHILLPQRNGTMEGFWYQEHSGRFDEGLERLSGWLQDGSIKEILDIAEGFDVVPEAARSIFAGANVDNQMVRLGKQLVRIADDPAM